MGVQMTHRRKESTLSGITHQNSAIFLIDIFWVLNSLCDFDIECILIVAPCVLFHECKRIFLSMKIELVILTVLY